MAGSRALRSDTLTPFYEDGSVVIYCGDSDEILPLLDVDVDFICTDPPYNVSVRNGRDGTTVGRLARKDGTFREVTKDFGEWDHDWDPAVFLEESVRLLRDGGSLVAFTSEFLLDAYVASGLDHRNLLYWRKPNPAPAFRKFYVRAVEMAVWQTKGGGWTLNAGGYRPNVFDDPIVSGFSTVNNAEPRVHPTQKPVSLMTRLVELHSNEGEMVLDPYMGSGTTLVAAKKCGRRAIGIELNPDYCEAAVKRLAQGVLV